MMPWFIVVVFVVVIVVIIVNERVFSIAAAVVDNALYLSIVTVVLVNKWRVPLKMMPQSVVL